ncbi:MauE/DoxX family redox-associated membrane protein [Chryseobacterium cheonjiense]|uniref:Tellurium resistance protein TerC n=1 Tax=Chryseobacterium cheonjiense TaxID=2728845 RepID=A0A7Y0A579_9FLAO|nr:MauE/DoxX family redox-associated membrane protein [Chryseobacterium cheonjiense]NML56773.1 tellurium resistance protein TerC [Chryseobacterium cheonjiense]
MKTFKSKFVEYTSYFFILLFCYASISKMMDFENFQFQIGQSPLLSSYATIVSYGILAAELVVSTVLIFETTRRAGLYISFTLMVLFSLYIYIILNYSNFVPCSCGGILEKMSWRTHLVFNLLTVALSAAALLIQASIMKRSVLSPLLLMTGLTLLGTGSMLYLYHRSEYFVQKENNFVRKFLPHAVDEEDRFDLKVNSYYFAGSDNDVLYLGNHTTPFVLSAIDVNFRELKTLQIIPDQADFSFNSSKFLVRNQKYYLWDGTVPVLYQGDIGKPNMTTISYKDSHFSQLQALDNGFFVMLTYSPREKIQALALLSSGPTQERVKIYPGLLEKTNDGIFDTDGKLTVDPYNNNVIYTYSYMNKFIVLDQYLQRKKVFHTIDDLSHQEIDVIQLKNGQKKMKKNPITVNKFTFAYRGLLFIESDRPGKLENNINHKQSIIIDIYSTNSQQYLGSFLLPNPQSSKKTQFYIKDNRLYVMIENELIRYRFAQNIVKQFKSGEAENLNTE